MPEIPSLSSSQCEHLLDMAETADRSLDWPQNSWQILREAGAFGWSIPTEFGGAGLAHVEVLQGMEQIASCCLTTAFALSQREAAIRHLLRASQAVKARYLPRLAAGEIHATVGLSQLTTSRQHLGPALRATPISGDAFELDGEIPWVTGADQAAIIVAGATLPDGRQLLILIPKESLVGSIEPPLRLAALSGSRTSLIRCSGVRIEADWILAGPTENVLGTSGGGGLDTSCLAIGLSAAAIEFIRNESQSRRDLYDLAQRLDESLCVNRDRLHSFATSQSDQSQVLDLRLKCTRLALHATQACLMVAKGVGFVTPHPAQRWIRQATFFLVWSCPRPVAEGLLAEGQGHCP